MKKRRSQRDAGAPPTAGRDQGLLSQAGFAGSTMDLPHRAQLEAELGLDLSGIQAQLGNGAAMDALNANAFASGDLVAFDSAQPSYEQAREEVLHVLQQGKGQGKGISDPNAESERKAGQGVAGGTGQDASLHRDTASPEEDAQTVGEIVLSPGVQYTVTAADMAAGTESAAWTAIARAHGMHPDRLVPFNQHVETVQQEDGETVDQQATISLAEGVSIYIPSAQEVVFSQCRERAETLQEAEQLYGTLASGANIQIIEAARHRASGDIGVAYGNKGIEQRNGNAGAFYTPNPELAGASSRRSDEIGGRTEYRVNWNATNNGFWKCSVFLHDVMFQAGFDPHMTDNNHYQLAGRLNESDKVTEVNVSEAGPGALWQRFGGRGSDESHNAILTSFVDVKNIDDETDEWTFSILGAEQSSAGESIRTKQMKKGTNETTHGEKFVRFFKPAGT